MSLNRVEDFFVADVGLWFALNVGILHKMPGLAGRGLGVAHARGEIPRKQN